MIENPSLGFAQDEVCMLSSPMRQLYYLAGLLVTTTKSGEEVNYTKEDWTYIVDHLNAIETEYFKNILLNSVLKESVDYDATEKYMNILSRLEKEDFIILNVLYQPQLANENSGNILKIPIM